MMLYNVSIAILETKYSELTLKMPPAPPRKGTMPQARTPIPIFPTRQLNIPIGGVHVCPSAGGATNFGTNYFAIMVLIYFGRVKSFIYNQVLG
jgi:hypothetical protein